MHHGALRPVGEEARRRPQPPAPSAAAGLRGEEPHDAKGHRADDGAGCERGAEGEREVLQELFGGDVHGAIASADGGAGGRELWRAAGELWQSAGSALCALLACEIAPV